MFFNTNLGIPGSSWTLLSACRYSHAVKPFGLIRSSEMKFYNIQRWFKAKTVQSIQYGEAPLLGVMVRWPQT